jgi:hypothetical protein
VKPCLFSGKGFNVREHGIERAFQLALAHKPSAGETNAAECMYQIGG